MSLGEKHKTKYLKNLWKGKKPFSSLGSRENERKTKSWDCCVAKYPVQGTSNKYIIDLLFPDDISYLENKHVPVERLKKIDRKEYKKFSTMYTREEIEEQLLQLLLDAAWKS